MAAVTGNLPGRPAATTVEVVEMAGVTVHDKKPSPPLPDGESVTCPAPTPQALQHLYLTRCYDNFTGETVAQAYGSRRHVHRIDEEHVAREHRT